MEAAQYMHPLCKTYEEVKRCKERMIGVKINFVQPDDILLHKISTMIEKMDEIIHLIPVEYHKTRHELSKEKE